MRVDGDRAAFRGCRFVGWQDTILLNRGRQYLEDCFVSGSVDFIFGGATAFFERCRIHARGDGYVTAASTPQEERHGFVFRGCRITGEPGVKTFAGPALARLRQCGVPRHRDVRRRAAGGLAQLGPAAPRADGALRRAGEHGCGRPSRRTGRVGAPALGRGGARSHPRERAVGGGRLEPGGRRERRHPGEGDAGGGPADRGATPRAPPPARFTPGRRVRARGAAMSLRLDACVPAGSRAVRGRDPRARRRLVGRGSDEGRSVPCSSP